MAVCNMSIYTNSLTFGISGFIVWALIHEWHKRNILTDSSKSGVLKHKGLHLTLCGLLTYTAWPISNNSKTKYFLLIFLITSKNVFRTGCVSVKNITYNLNQQTATAFVIK